MRTFTQFMEAMGQPMAPATPGMPTQANQPQNAQNKALNAQASAIIAKPGDKNKKIADINKLYSQQVATGAMTPADALKGMA